MRSHPGCLQHGDQWTRSFDDFIHQMQLNLRDLLHLQLRAGLTAAKKKKVRMAWTTDSMTVRL